MGLVRDWRRQAARATGISLIAPVVLLVSATLVAASGGGFGGVGSLGQIATGPPLPDGGVAAAPQGSLGDPAVAAIPPAPSRPPSGPPVAGATGAATSSSSEVSQTPTDAPVSPMDEDQLAAVTPNPPNSPEPVEDPGPVADPAPLGAPAAQSPPNPLRGPIDQVRGGLPPLPGVDPVLDDLLNTLLLPAVPLLPPG